MVETANRLTLIRERIERDMKIATAYDFIGPALEEAAEDRAYLLELLQKAGQRLRETSSPALLANPLDQPAGLPDPPAQVPPYTQVERPATDHTQMEVAALRRHLTRLIDEACGALERRLTSQVQIEPPVDWTTGTLIASR